MRGRIVLKEGSARVMMSRAVTAVCICLSVLNLAGCAPEGESLGSAAIPEAQATGTPSSVAIIESSATASRATQTPTPLYTADEALLADIREQLEGLPIDEFFEQSYRQIQLRDPDRLFINGLAEAYGVPADRFTNISDGYVRETQQLEAMILELLRVYDPSVLSSDQQLTYDIYEWVLADRVRGHEFMYYDYPVNSMTIWGKQNWLIDFMVNYLPIASLQDAEDYIARISQIDTWVMQLLEGLMLREAAGIVPPRYVVRDSIDQVEGHLHMQGPDAFDVEAIDLYTSFAAKLDQVEIISDLEKQALLDAALTEIESTFIPAFLELRSYLRQLERVAGNQSGVYRLAEGEPYYAYILRNQTSVDLSPEEIHELGMSEVARLEGEILAAAADLGYGPDISMAELDQQLSLDSEMLAGEALLDEYERLIAGVEAAVHLYFDLLPETELVIQPEPFGSGIGYYLPPAFDGSTPGRFYTTLDYPIPRHVIPTFLYHETVPGHHLQGALARELDLPSFRRELEMNAHMEGWAVYAERLAWEMGLYATDPMGNLGRLFLEHSRAVRLVLDTGIHAKGWTRQQAAAYYEQATGRPTGSAAMDRYVILPGQGCGYTIGLLTILDLRQMAEERLGVAFDIRVFHNVILGNGSLPLDILQQVVEDWIEGELRE
jgi:uncharacterized protein (DUF885 family)